MTLEVSSRRLGEFHVVDVVGDVDVMTAEVLRDVLARTLDGGPVDVVVNLGGVEFVDSTGLGVLVTSLRRTRLVGGDLQLVVDSARLRGLLEITALDNVFTVRETVEKAVARV